MIWISEMKRLLVLGSLAAFVGLLAGCATDAGISDDPDLLTDTEEIPNRAGAIETLSGKKLEVEF